MYINPFIAGVFVTLFIEMAIYVCWDVSRKSRATKQIYKRQNV